MESKSCRVKTYSVRILDMFHWADPEHEYEIEGFPSLELAREFARRWVRDSLGVPGDGVTKEKLRSSWYMFGEDAGVIGGHYFGSDELDFFLDNPASAEELDWKSVLIDAGLDVEHLNG